MASTAPGRDPQAPLDQWQYIRWAHFGGPVALVKYRGDGFCQPYVYSKLPVVPDGRVPQDGNTDPYPSVPDYVPPEESADIDKEQYKKSRVYLVSSRNVDFWVIKPDDTDYIGVASGVNGDGDETPIGDPTNVYPPNPVVIDGHPIFFPYEGERETIHKNYIRIFFNLLPTFRSLSGYRVIDDGVSNYSIDRAIVTQHHGLIRELVWLVNFGSLGSPPGAPKKLVRAALAQQGDLAPSWGTDGSPPPESPTASIKMYSGGKFHVGSDGEVTHIDGKLVWKKEDITAGLMTAGDIQVFDAIGPIPRPA